MNTFKFPTMHSANDAGIRTVCLCLLWFFIMGCTQQEMEPVVPDEDGSLIEQQSEETAARIANLRRIHKDNPVEMSGFQNYYTYALKLRKNLQDAYADCDVKLEFLEGNNIQLTMIEYSNESDEQRISVFQGKMTRWGLMSFAFPTPLMVMPDGSGLYITDIIAGHTGCSLYGNTISQKTLTYYGLFDGERLRATAPFFSICDQPWEPNDIFETPVEGLILWKWRIDVTVD